ncbi:UbiA family prenyltransferase [Vibrio sp. Vb2880]|uniref:UbiA family prenyltransferase n=1 Tax=Vibrio sp. Vb2880 TaxID=2816076 RepID=UPI00296400E1|nr:UbiA family prenyltransferase [Vibrio sp. Vb2880]MDW1576529.1 UbiA family prenyltransferase [Vibrio sp. Vb2880]
MISLIDKKSPSLHTLLCLGRISNLPTVWSNVLAAFFWTAWVTQKPIEGLVLLWLCVAFSLLYLGGMYLNDASDVDWDRIHNPERPIIQGQISQRLVLCYSLVLLTSGFILLLALAFQTSVQYVGLLTSLALLLLFCIVSYNCLHKRYSLSRFLMGACRALIYLICAQMMADSFSDALAIALPLAGYISGVTLLAQYEHTTQKSHWYSLTLLLSPWLLTLALPVSLPLIIMLAMCTYPTLKHLILRFIKTNQQPSTPSIGALLSRIPLYDAAILLACSQWWGVLFCIGYFSIAPKLHRWIAPS